MDLYNYQKRAIDFLDKNKRCALFIEMGLGKTIICLKYLKYLQCTDDVFPVLILAPPKVAEFTWQDENEKWGMGFKILHIKGSPEKREKLLKEEADIYIISDELFCWLAEKKKKFNFVIIDEFSRFRSPSSKKFKAMKKYRPERLIGLTGTPAPNGIYYIWGLIFLLDYGERLGFKNQFESNYFTPDKRSRYIIYSYKPMRGAEVYIYKKIKDICLSMKQKDYLELPEFKTIILKGSFNRKLKNMYFELEKELFLLLDDGEIDAVSAAVLVNKLKQFCNGNIYDEKKEVHQVHKIKIDMLKELIMSCEGKNVLIVYNYVSDKKIILENIEGADELIFDKWGRGEQKIALIHPASCGHGLNLQYGGNILVWFGPTYDLELYLQACKRLHRPGQKKIVLNYILCIDESIDLRVMDALGTKEYNQDNLLSALGYLK